MYTEKTKALFSAVITLVVIFGLIAGILAGIALMGPTAENIQKATQFPTLFGDELLEEHWNTNCTLVTGAIWLITAIVATSLYGKKISLEMQDTIIEKIDTLINKK